MAAGRGGPLLIDAVLRLLWRLSGLLAVLCVAVLLLQRSG
jgi:hypothetical protein